MKDSTLTGSGPPEGLDVACDTCGARPLHFCQGLPPPLCPGGGRLAYCHRARREKSRSLRA